MFHSFFGYYYTPSMFFPPAFVDGLHGNLSHSKFLQVSRILPSMLANLNNAVVWMVLLLLFLLNKRERKKKGDQKRLVVTQISMKKTCNFWCGKLSKNKIIEERMKAKTINYIISKYSKLAQKKFKQCLHQKMITLK